MNVTVCDAELVSTVVFGNANGVGKAVAAYAATVPFTPTFTDPAEVVRLSKPEVAPGLVVGDGTSFTSITQLAIASKPAPQVVPEMENSGGDTPGTPSVIAVAPELAIVTVCGSDCVPCAVDAKVSEAGTAVTTGAVAVPTNAQVYVNAGCTVTGATGSAADVKGPMVNVALSLEGTAWLYRTTTWQVAPAATGAQVFDATVNAAKLVDGITAVTGTLSALKNVKVCDWLPPATIEKFV